MTGKKVSKLGAIASLEAYKSGFQLPANWKTLVCNTDIYVYIYNIYVYIYNIYVYIYIYMYMCRSIDRFFSFWRISVLDTISWNLHIPSTPVLQDECVYVYIIGKL